MMVKGLKRKYYYLVAGLQDILLDTHKLVQDQLAFKAELKQHLHPDDFALVRKLFLPYDNRNLLIMLQKEGKPLDERGNFSREELDNGIKDIAGLPPYMLTFIQAFKTKEPVYQQLSPENELTALFLEEVIQGKNDFLRAWYAFDLNLRNIMTALSGRKHGLEIASQIIGSGEVADALRKSVARDFGMGSELPYLERIIEVARLDDVKEREKALDQMRWEYLDEETFFAYFTIDRLLSHVIKLGLVERWLALDEEYGQGLFRQLLKDLQGSYQLPGEFTDK